MKFKKILSSFLAFAVAFAAVSFAPFENNGSLARQRLSKPKVIKLQIIKNSDVLRNNS